MKTIIERGQSWSLEETKLLLLLWGADIVQRQATNTKRTKEVYERIAEKFSQNGHTRTPDQVRTRIFNMIAEYRRILKELHVNPERAKKCVFFEPLHKIYQAKHMEDIKNALDDYEPDNPYSPASGDDSVSDNEATPDGNETINNLTNDTTKILASPNEGQTLTQSTNSCVNNTTNNTVLLENNGEVIGANNSTEKDSSSSHSSNSHSNSGEGATSKKIKLESPKSGQNQTSLPSTSSTSTNSSTSTDHQQATNKQNKSSASSHHGAAYPNVASAAASSSSSATSSSQKHQSLLLPHATTSSGASTPISKLTTTGSNSTPSYININSTKLPIIRTNQLIGHSNGNESINLNGTTTRLPTTAAITSHQLYQAPVNTFDVTSSALLIDRMFAHLSRESENMREWIALEKERLALERTRRQQETEREVRRERVLIDTLMRFQDQWLSFLSRLDSRLIESCNESPPELLIPKEATQSSTSSSADQTQLTQTSQANQNSCSASTVTNSNQSAEASKP